VGSGPDSLEGPENSERSQTLDEKGRGVKLNAERTALAKPEGWVVELDNCSIAKERNSYNSLGGGGKNCLNPERGQFRGWGQEKTRVKTVLPKDARTEKSDWGRWFAGGATAMRRLKVYLIPIEGQKQERGLIRNRPAKTGVAFENGGF